MTESAALILILIFLIVSFCLLELLLGGGAFGMTGLFLMISAPLFCWKFYPEQTKWLIAGEIIFLALMIYLLRKRKVANP